jgi:hypothetical protein
MVLIEAESFQFAYAKNTTGEGLPLTIDNLLGSSWTAYGPTLKAIASVVRPWELMTAITPSKFEVDHGRAR